MSKEPAHLCNDDSLLLKKLKSGSESAWKEIFDRHNTVLFYKAYDLLNDTEEAKDVVQELFIALWAKRAHLILRSSTLEAYLHNALYNRCLNKLTSKQTYKKHITEFSYLNNDPSYDQASNNKEILLNRLSDALQQLSHSPAYNAFELMHLQNKNYREVSQQLGIHPGSVRNQVSKILKKLREKLAP